MHAGGWSGGEAIGWSRRPRAAEAVSAADARRWLARPSGEGARRRAPRKRRVGGGFEPGVAEPSAEFSAVTWARAAGCVRGISAEAAVVCRSVAPNDAGLGRAPDSPRLWRVEWGPSPRYPAGSRSPKTSLSGGRRRGSKATVNRPGFARLPGSQALSRAGPKPKSNRKELRESTRARVTDSDEGEWGGGGQTLREIPPAASRETRTRSKARSNRPPGTQLPAGPSKKCDGGCEL